METRERRLHTNRNGHKSDSMKKAINFFSTLFLHALSLAIIAAFLIWILKIV